MSSSRLIVATLLVIFAEDAAAQSPVVSPFKPLEFLVGSCWIGSFPGGKQTDRHCFEWVYDGKFIRDRHVVPGAKPYLGETLYHADPKTGKVSYTYWSSDGLVMTGGVEELAGSLVFPSRYSTAQGEVEIKATWTRTGPDGYRVTNAQKAGAEWKEMWTMEMKRDGVAPRTP